MKAIFGEWTDQAVREGRSFLRDETGTTAIEYALLVSISIAVAAAVYQLGGAVNALYERVYAAFQ